jgi:hypothetical protein
MEPLPWLYSCHDHHDINVQEVKGRKREPSVSENKEGMDLHLHWEGSRFWSSEATVSGT